MIPTPNTLLEATVVFVVFIVASARVTRLVVADTFPPSVRLRIWYEDKVPEGWDTLLQCPWCFAFWVVLLNGAVGWAALALGGGWFTVWFVGNLLFAAAYAASWLVFHDEDD